MKLQNKNTLKDALYNADSINAGFSGYNVTYGRGVVVGVVSAIMAITGLTFQDAVKEVMPYLPDNLDNRCIPNPWKEEFGIKGE